MAASRFSPGAPLGSRALSADLHWACARPERASRDGETATAPLVRMPAVHRTMELDPAARWPPGRVAGLPSAVMNMRRFASTLKSITEPPKRTQELAMSPLNLCRHQRSTPRRSPCP